MNKNKDVFFNLLFEKIRSIIDVRSDSRGRDRMKMAISATMEGKKMPNKGDCCK